MNSSELAPGLGNADHTLEASISAVSWPAIIAGAFVAVSASLVLLTLGSGLGLATASPWSNSGPSATGFALMTGIWLIVVQWAASGFGGILPVGSAQNGSAPIRTKSSSATPRTVSLLGLVAVRTGVSHADAQTRVDDLISRVTAAEAKTRQAADSARKAASAFSIFTTLSMLIGAFIACAASALGGQQRDEHP
jgi:hypothetical protein